jgi:hypothetical protein
MIFRSRAVNWLNLEGILCILFVAQDRLAEAQHHRSGPRDRSRKQRLDCLIQLACEPFRELPVCQLGCDPSAENRTDVPQDNTVRFDRHAVIASR